MPKKNFNVPRQILLDRLTNERGGVNLIGAIFVLAGVALVFATVVPINKRQETNAVLNEAVAAFASTDVPLINTTADGTVALVSESDAVDELTKVRNRLRAVTKEDFCAGVYRASIKGGALDLVAPSPALELRDSLGSLCPGANPAAMDFLEAQSESLRNETNPRPYFVVVADREGRAIAAAPLRSITRVATAGVNSAPGCLGTGCGGNSGPNQTGGGGPTDPDAGGGAPGGGGDPNGNNGNNTGSGNYNNMSLGGGANGGDGSFGF